MAWKACEYCGTYYRDHPAPHYCAGSQAAEDLKEMREALGQLDASMGKSIAFHLYDAEARTYPDFLKTLFPWAR